jgi:hypothetical protein
MPRPNDAAVARQPGVLDRLPEGTAALLAEGYYPTATLPVRRISSWSSRKAAVTMLPDTGAQASG